MGNVGGREKWALTSQGDALGAPAHGGRSITLARRWRPSTTSGGRINSKAIRRNILISCFIAGLKK
jgi:hypothetical protein